MIQETKPTKKVKIFSCTVSNLEKKEIGMSEIQTCIPTVRYIYTQDISAELPTELSRLSGEKKSLIIDPMICEFEIIYELQCD